jgi:hypothetical protein
LFSILTFGKKKNVTLGADFWSEEDKITAEENELLEAPFSVKEIKEAVFHLTQKGRLAQMGSLFSSIKSFGR